MNSTWHTSLVLVIREEDKEREHIDTLDSCRFFYRLCPCWVSLKRLTQLILMASSDLVCFMNTGLFIIVNMNASSNNSVH